MPPRAAGRHGAPCCGMCARPELIINRNMQQVVEFEPQTGTERPNHAPPLAFLDTDVVLSYLRGEPSAVQLFSAESEGRIRFAINSIVLQELILTTDAAVQPELERVVDHLKMLPEDFAKAEALAVEASRDLKAMPGPAAGRKRLPHSNNLIILSSLGDCDFLVTTDRRLKDLVANGRPQAVTPTELVARLRAA